MLATFRKCAPLAAAAALLAPPAAPRPQAQDEDEATQSVVLIVLDDLGTDQLAFYLPELDPGSAQPPCGAVPPPGGRAFPCTPELQRLRDEGILFTNAYANPSCTPTRAAILTGRYGFRTGMGLALDEGQDCGAAPLAPCDGPESLSDAEIFLPELVRAASDDPDVEIACGAFGKWHLTYVQGNECHPVHNGFDLFQGNMGNGANTQVGPDHFDWIDTAVAADGAGGCALLSSARTANVRTCPPAQPANTWDAALTRRRARRWIEQQIALRRPFFAYVAFNPPHAAYQVPPFCELSPQTQAYLLSLGLDETGDDVGASTVGSDDERRVAIYNAMVEALDREIARLLAGLDGVMVVVVGDNGTPDRVLDAPPSPYPPCRGKRTVYQHGVRVPLIVAGPRVDPTQRGATAHGLVDAVDLWRTVANLLGVSEREIDAFLAGLADPLDVDSRSFLPLILHPDQAGARALSYAEVFHPNQGDVAQGAPFDPDVWLQMATDGTYKLVRKGFGLQWSGGEIVSGDTVEELFRIASDPDERDPLCAPLPDPAACASGCPPPACHAPSNPACGDPGCADPAACCGAPCPPPPGHPAAQAYARLARFLNRQRP